jgi:hypothetical protein
MTTRWNGLAAHLRNTGAFALLILLAACGGSGDAGLAAPSELKYPTPTSFTVGTPIGSLAPSYQGSYVTFAITPQLPPGLTMDANGVIGGTPTAEAPTTAYTVTAANSGGMTSTQLTLTVNLPPPVVSYGNSTLLSTLSRPSSFVPTNTGGAVASWSINAALPGGLTFSTTDGSISGTATTPTAPTSYTVSAKNSGGTSTVTVIIDVAELLLDLGHATAIAQIGVTPTRALSVDVGLNWVLWNYATREEIASGMLACGPHTCNGGIAPPYHVADIAGSTYAIQVVGGVQLRSAADGSPLTTLAVPADTWALASDGSYLCSATKSALTAWGFDGRLIATRAGDYTQAALVCTPGAMRVAKGPAGAQVIETIALPSGASAVGPAFQGNFWHWFSDGGSFVTALASTVWVYSAASIQLDVRQLPPYEGIAGEGSWFWTWDSANVNIYSVGAGAAPALTVPSSVAPATSGPTVAVTDSTRGGLHILDLSQASPVDNFYPKAQGGIYAATSAQQWLISSGGPGVLVDGTTLAATPSYFGYGAPLSMVGSPARLALATASGKTFIYDAASWSVAGTLDSLEELALSADGTVLAARGHEGSNYIVRTYRLPGATPINTWTYPWSGSIYPLHVALSADGTTLAQVLLDNSGPKGQVSGVGSNVPTWSATLPASYSGTSWWPIRLAPNGSLWTTTRMLRVGFTTDIYAAGSFVTTVNGSAQAWLTNNRLLAAEYAGNAPIAYQTFDPSGASSGAVPVPSTAFGALDVQVLGADSLYQPASNSIWTVSTGTTSWVGPAPRDPSVYAGAVAGGRVIYLAGNEMVMQPQ